MQHHCLITFTAMKNSFKLSILFVLLAIIIPCSSASAQNKLKSFDDDTRSQNVEVVKTNTGYNYNYFTPGFVPTMDIEYGWFENGYTYEATIGTNYEFVKNLYVGARIGYLGTGSSYNILGMSFSSDAHYISLPLEFGYTLVSESKFGVVPFVGLGLAMGLTGKSKYDGYESKLDIGGEFSIDGRVGLRLMLAGWTISGTYHFPLNDNMADDGHIGISIGWFLYD